MVIEIDIDATLHVADEVTDFLVYLDYTIYHFFDSPPHAFCAAFCAILPRQY